MGFIESLLGSAKADLSNLIIYIAIVAAFIVGLIMCIAPVLETRSRLRRAIRSIKAGEKARRSWQEDNFLGKGTLMPHWSAYLNNLFFADGVYHNASNVEDFINEDTVIYGPGRISFADALPSLLVSLGFLGTLIGLAQGLSGFDMTDSATVQNSITTLIPGMKYAFMTSIFGVVGSVLFTLLTRAVYGSTQHAIKDFYGALSHSAGVISVDPLTQVAIYQQEQTALIQTMSKDLNGAFTENMANAIRDAVEPIHASLKNFLTVSTKDQMRFLDAVVMRFVDRMDESLNGRLKEFSQVLGETTRAQEEAFSAVRMSMLESEAAVRDLRGIQKISQDMIDAMTSYLNDLRTTHKQADDAYARMSSSVEQMELVSRQQTGYLKTVSAMQAEISRSLETMTGAVNEFTRKFAAENAAASQAMQQAAQSLNEAGAHIENAQKSASRELDAELKNTLDAYRDYVNQFTQRVDYLSSNISDSLSRMPRAVADTSDQFLDQVQQLTETLAKAQRGLDDAVDRLYRR